MKEVCGLYIEIREPFMSCNFTLCLFQPCSKGELKLQESSSYQRDWITYPMPFSSIQRGRVQITGEFELLKSSNYQRVGIIREFKLPSGLEWPLCSNYHSGSNHGSVQITIQWEKVWIVIRLGNLGELELPLCWGNFEEFFVSVSGHRTIVEIMSSYNWELWRKWRMYVMVIVVIEKLNYIWESLDSQQWDLLANICWIPRGKWDSLRDCWVEKGISFLGLCKLMGKKGCGLGLLKVENW